jgi:Glyoxalase/Bleomycin resistance protein/Dioxygenase superfamily
MKRIMLLLVLALSLLADGQSAQAAKALSDPPFTAKGAFFALSVPDLESSARWYSEKFGLKIVMQAPKTKTLKSAVTVLAGGGLLVELIQNDEALEQDCFGHPVPRVCPWIYEIRSHRGEF